MRLSWDARVSWVGWCLFLPLTRSTPHTASPPHPSHRLTLRWEEKLGLYNVTKCEAMLRDPAIDSSSSSSSSSSSHVHGKRDPRCASRFNRNGNRDDRVRTHGEAKAYRRSQRNGSSTSTSTSTALSRSGSPLKATLSLRIAGNPYPNP